MARTPKFIPRRTGKKTSPWVVNIPKSVSVDGSQHKEYFKNKEDAETRSAQLKQDLRRRGEGALAAPVALREQAVRSDELLEPFGVDLVDAVREWVEASRVISPLGGDMVQVARSWAKDEKQRRQSREFGELMDEVIATLVNRRKSTRYIGDVRYVRKRLMPFWGGVMVSDIRSKAEILKVFADAGLKPTGQKSFQRVLSVAFNHAVEREYTTSNPFAKLKTDEGARRDVGILTPEEVEVLYAAAGDDLRPYLIFSTWGGIRPAEVRRLQWADVSWEEGWVQISRKIAKRDKTRNVTLSENALELLKPYRHRTGKVVPFSESTWKRRFEAARVTAGICEQWQENMLRHSFGTYHRAFHKDLDLLAMEMGHSETQTAANHYVKSTIGVKEAIKFWSIGLPKKSKAKKSKGVAA